MNQNILHVGLDVDDTQYHGSAFNRNTGEVIDFRCRPTLKGLLTQLDKLQLHFRGCSIRLCYEASYAGFCLQRDLRSHGVHCDVVAPSSVPSPRGKAVKTDRINAGHLAQFYANERQQVYADFSVRAGCFLRGDNAHRWKVAQRQRGLGPRRQGIA